MGNKQGFDEHLLNEFVVRYMQKRWDDCWLVCQEEYLLWISSDVMFCEKILFIKALKCELRNPFVHSCFHVLHWSLCYFV